jgi:hypothetical protein
VNKEMENLYVHSITKKEVPVRMTSEGFHCEQLRSLVEANFSRDQLMKLNATMESPTGAMDVLQRSFNAVTGGIKKYIHSIVGRQDTYDTEILKSKGDISKIQRIDTTLKILRLFAKDKNRTISRRAGQVLRLYDHIHSMKATFMLGYQNKGSLNGSFVWGTYVIYAQYIVVCTSHLAAMHANVMKHESYALRNLDDQIKGCSDGTLKKWCEFFMKKKKSDFVKEDGGLLVVTAVLLGTVITAAFFLRVLVFYFYYCRMQLSDYLNQQSDYFNLHASEVKKSGMDSSQKDAVLKAQKTWADRFAMLSDAIVVEDLKASRKTTDTIKVANKEVNPSKIDVPNVGMDFI